jgi:hypothetical protein
LIPPKALLRVAQLYERGAKKYGENNWEKGMNFARLTESMLRHGQQWLEGDRQEDHLAAVVFNAFAMMHFQEIGREQELNDLSFHRFLFPAATNTSETVAEGAVHNGPRC